MTASWDLPDREAPAFAALLPHDMMLDDAVLLSTPRPRRATLALGRVWTVMPRNIDVCGEAVCLQIARSLENLLLGLPDGSAMQVLMQIRPATAALAWDALRATTAAPAVPFQRAALAQGLPHTDGGTLAGRLREVTTLVTVRLPVAGIPPTLVQRVRAVSTLTDRVPASLLAVLERALVTSRVQLDSVALALEDALHAAGISVTRLDGVAVGVALARSLQPLATPPMLDSTQPLRTQVLTVPATPVPSGWQVGALVTHVLSLRSAPVQTFPGMLSATRTPPDTRPLALWDAWPAHPLALVVNLAVPPRQDEITRLRQKRILALWQQRTALGDTAVETQAIKDELDAMLRRAFTAGDRLVWARVHVVAWGPSPTVARADDAVIQAGRRIGLEFLPEPVLGSTLFLQTLPLGFDPAYPEERFLRRAHRLPSPNLAQLLPLYGTFRGTATPAMLYLNRRGETVHFDPFDSPTAPHGVVIGTSGSGKSFLINHLVQQVLPLGAAVVILDRWASYEQLCTVHGGRYVALEYNQPICVNPFLGPLDRGHRAFLGALLAEMASGGDESLSREERGVLADTLATFAQQHPPQQEARLGDFVTHLRALPATDDARSLGLRLARKLGPYYGDGPYAGFFDGPNAFTLDRVLTVVELSSLRGTPDVQAALMFVLLHQLTLFFADPGRLLQRKYLISDETWALLQHAASARVLEEIARTFRKLQTAALFLSQQGSDFLSPAGKAIRDNSGFAYFLQQNPEEVETMRTLFDLTDPEVALLKTVRRRPGWSEAYLRLPEQQGGVIRLVPDPYLRWLATQQPQERAQRQAALDAARGDLHQAVMALATQELAAGGEGTPS
jgi:hypothetical protein